MIGYPEANTARYQSRWYRGGAIMIVTLLFLIAKAANWVPIFFRKKMLYVRFSRIGYNRGR
jgi:hypothetical protein